MLYCSLREKHRLFQPDFACTHHKILKASFEKEHEISLHDFSAAKKTVIVFKSPFWIFPFSFVNDKVKPQVRWLGHKPMFFCIY